MSNLPINDENNFITKIKKIIRKFFYLNHKTPIIETVEKVNGSIDDTIKNQKFDDYIKVETYEDEFDKSMKLGQQREEFLDKLCKNPNMLDELSFERLEKLNKHLDITINNYRNETKKLQNA